MRKWTLLIVVLMSSALGWGQDYADHRNDLWAMAGKDFWFCVPKTMAAFSANKTKLCVVAERDCMVTVEIPRMDFHHTYQARAYTTIDIRLDIINFYEPRQDYIEYIDSLYTGVAVTSQPGYGPQNKGVHITSTDTIAVSVVVRGLGSTDIMQVPPTEMLRDEYVIQSYPETYRPVGDSFFDVVATEDSTEVEIILSDDDWMGRHAGDTFTVMMMRGHMLHVAGKDVPNTMIREIWTHGFDTHRVLATTLYTDLSGTRVKAKGHKRIAVVEGNREAMIPFSHYIGGTPNADIAIEMALPTAYAGKYFLVPNLTVSDTDYLRFTALANGATLTITDHSRVSDQVRTLTVGPYQTEWFQMDYGEGPFYITSTEPVMLALFTMGNNFYHSDHTFGKGDPAMLIVKPIEWWNCNPIHHHTPFYTDNNYNVYAGEIETHLFCRTADVPFMNIDSYSVSEYFTPLTGTPFSYAHFDRYSQFNSLGVHDIHCTQEGYFMAFCQQYDDAMHALWTLPHVQPGGCYLTANGVPAEQLREDSVWCMYDSIDFHGWSDRPADSIFWDLGDGTRLALGYDEGQHLRHAYSDTGRYVVQRIIRWRDESEDVYAGGKRVFTRTDDTMAAPIWVRNHEDSTLMIRLCEGSFYFRGIEYYYTDTFYHTTYWTESGCDTLWTIDLVTCPHCNFVTDTISSEQLPWHYHGLSFGGSATDYPVYIDIDDECDSIVYYTLVVIKNWGQEPDSITLMVPNVITPNRDNNNQFQVIAHPSVREMRVWIYDRRGQLVKEMDGLTETWDGTKEGQPLRQETYTYYIRYRDTKSNGWKSLKGTVTVLR